MPPVREDGSPDFGIRRATAILGPALFLVLVPGTIAGYIPWRISHWQAAPPLLGFLAFRRIGVLFLGARLPVLLDSFTRFAIRPIVLTCGAGFHE